MAFGTSASLRVIATPQKTAEFLTRLEAFCRESKIHCIVHRNDAYYKIDGQQEAGVILSDCPTWSRTQWFQACELWFGKQKFIVEPNGEDVEFCSYPAYDDLESYFVIFTLPARCVRN